MIVVSGLTKSIATATHRVDILKGIDFDVPRGQFVAIMGQSGSGKSTLLDVLMGLLHPSEGKLLVDGQAITPSNCLGWQARIAHVPQSIFGEPHRSYHQ